MGMGVVIEYENRQGEPQWIKRREQRLGLHGIRANQQRAPSPDETIKLTFEKVPGGHGGYNRWTINGKSWPDTNPLFTVQQGKRYRLVMRNNSGDKHPVHTAPPHLRGDQDRRHSISGLDEGHAQYAAVLDGRDRFRR